MADLMSRSSFLIGCILPFSPKDADSALLLATLDLKRSVSACCSLRLRPCGEEL